MIRACAPEPWSIATIVLPERSAPIAYWPAGTAPNSGLEATNSGSKPFSPSLRRARTSPPSPAPVRQAA